MVSMCKRYTKDNDEATICMNNGFLKVFKNIHQLEKPSSLGAWMRRIMYNSISDHLRSKTGRVRFLEFESSSNTKYNDGYQGLLEEDILTMIDQLPQKSGEVFILYAIHGYKHKEIAKLKNISEGTSKWHLAEARKKLQSILANYMKENRYVG